jgi:two-component system, LytTR family, sensor kinase
LKNSFYKIFSSFWFLQIGGWLAYWLMIVITFLPVLAPDRSIFALFQLKLIRTLIGFGLSSIVRLIYRKHSNSSITLIAFVAVIGSVLTGSLWTILMNFYYWITSATFQLSSTMADFPRNSLDYSATILAWSAIYFGWKIWQKGQTEQENSLRSAALTQKAQLEMLRYQLNPHFLFNALNSIRASVDEDANRAKQMITQLSEFLRHSLLSVEKKEIPLREELEAVQNYLAIEKIRFEEKLAVEYDVDKKAEDFSVPCFLLNPLVENAIKHGLQTNLKPLRIKVSAKLNGKNLVLTVSNTGKLENLTHSNGTKIGLKNVRERLEKLFGEKSSFELTQAGDLVIAKIEICK